ncbi:Rid family detoxifying hydrolase [Sutterella sp.]|uniref:Rid family detoxifying hydrolase n=1 Tax=Sutterella sp. TaxID=1981025 RepID=UPI0026DECE5E|nr:Rid family detoxifying hydrolase [Sutterella sp.]MDO5531589.1 Rid family detoxifying hydrolase [Sutterella sp.]
MSRRIIHSDNAPAAIGPYSQAVADETTLYCSGQLGLDPATGALAEGAAAQARQAFTNLKNVIEAAGASMEDIMKVTIFLTSMDNFGAVNEAMQAFCSAPYPARSCFAVAALPKGGLVEIEAIVSLKR